MARYTNLIEESVKLRYDGSDLGGKIAGIHHAMKRVERCVREGCIMPYGRSVIRV